VQQQQQQQQGKQSEQIASAYALAERARHCGLSRMGSHAACFSFNGKTRKLKNQITKKTN
jgi:hypothetical protein